MKSIVLYPAPGVGHLMSMVELGKLILTRSQTHVSITVLIPSFPFTLHDTILSYISSVSSSFPSITFNFLPPISLIRGNSSNYPDSYTIMFEALQSNNPNVLSALKSLSSSSFVCAFILDMFCYTCLEIPCSLNIPTFFYFTSSANALSLFLNFPAIDKIATDSFRNINNMSFEIPTLYSVPSSQMLEAMLERGATYDKFVEMGAYLTKSDGIVVNTFESLELRAVKALKEETCVPAGTRVTPIYCIGPLIASPSKKEGERHECLSWLDSQPSKSVVYLCFGSRGLFSKEQILEIAVGLERSGVRFLWVVQTPDEDRDLRFESPSEPVLEKLLPEGFMESTKDRGLVVKSWAPQTDVLAHDSLGAFVTHCGWNSTLEAVCEGVPMVAWPLYAEQRFNKIVLVQEIGIALPMNESEDQFVCADEIEKRVKQILYSEEGDVVRKQVLNLRYEAKSVFDEKGSSKIGLTALVETWRLER